MRTIKELWVLTKEGIGVFYSNKNDEMKSQFLSMLLSAMNSIAHEISNSNLSSLEFQNKQYNILQKHNLLFVAQSETNSKRRNILKELKDISTNFFVKYGENFALNWDGNIDCCMGFQEDLEHYMPKQVQRIVEGFGWEY